MTDEEIVETLRRGDALLEEYKRLIEPVAVELAGRKSLHVFDQPGLYTGNLGCWESGIDLICLHIEDAGYDIADVRGDVHYDKVCAFEKIWRDKINLENICIGGHF